MFKKEEFIKEIKEAFKNVKLEDGIGLWEAQGHDDRLNIEECKKLRRKDEKEDWTKIPLIHVYQCSSSLTFFDAKGLRFHFPIFLLFALGVFTKEQQELTTKGELKGCSEPDIERMLVSISNFKNDTDAIQYKQFYIEQFSLFNSLQLNCIIKYLEYRMYELESYYKTDAAKEIGLLPIAIQYDKEYMQLQEVIMYWTNEFPSNSDHL